MPRLTDLTAATPPLDGTEEVYIVQGGNSRKATAQEVIDVRPVASQVEAEAGTADDVVMTPLRIRQAVRATGAAPIYACRAWVNFNGTGTVAIRGSGNVSSVTDNGTGDYTVNFTTALPDTNYATALGVERSRSTPTVGTFSGVVVSTTSYRIVTANTSGVLTDFEGISLAVFR